MADNRTLVVPRRFTSSPPPCVGPVALGSTHRTGCADPPWVKGAQRESTPKSIAPLTHGLLSKSHDLPFGLASRQFSTCQDPPLCSQSIRNRPLADPIACGICRAFPKGVLRLVPQGRPHAQPTQGNQEIRFPISTRGRLGRREARVPLAVDRDRSRSARRLPCDLVHQSRIMRRCRNLK